MPGVYVRSHHGVELKDLKPDVLCLTQTVGHQFFTNVQSSFIRADRIAGIADVSAPADIVGMEDVKAQDFSR